MLKSPKRFKLWARFKHLNKSKTVKFSRKISHTKNTARSPTVNTHTKNTARSPTVKTQKALCIKRTLFQNANLWSQKHVYLAKANKRKETNWQKKKGREDTKQIGMENVLASFSFCYCHVWMDDLTVEVWCRVRSHGGHEYRVFIYLSFSANWEIKSNKIKAVFFLIYKIK
jgi:hypothetical protein